MSFGMDVDEENSRTFSDPTTTSSSSLLTNRIPSPQHYYLFETPPTRSSINRLVPFDPHISATFLPSVPPHFHPIKTVQDVRKTTKNAEEIKNRSESVETIKTKGKSLEDSKNMDKSVDDRKNLEKMRPKIIPIASVPLSKKSTGSTAQSKKEAAEAARHLQDVFSGAAKSSDDMLQRLSTVEGWKQMNSWLKIAERACNWSRLTTLLKQCFLVPVTVELLKLNDTPKCIRRLSKNCANNDLRKLATDLVQTWKEDVIARPEGSRPPDLSLLPDKSPEEPPLKSPPSLLEKYAPDLSKTIAFPLDEKPKLVLKNRPRTAKTYPTKFRSTGLEGDDDEIPVKKKPKSPVKMPVRKLTPVLPAQKPIHNPMEFNPEQKIVRKMSPIKPAAKMVESMGFMDAIQDQVTQKKPKIVRKQRTVPIVVKSSGSATTSLYSDTSRISNNSSPYLESKPKNAGQSSPITAGPSISVSKRKVKFADENQLELVEIRYFEIEDGERVNVNHLSNLDMKHEEMKREKAFMEQARKSRQNDDIKNEWALIPCENGAILVENGSGSKSESKLIEKQRQLTVMEVFYDQFHPTDYPSEPDPNDTRPSNDHQSRSIPLEDTSLSSPTVTASCGVSMGSNDSQQPLPTSLQCLMDGLRGHRLVGPNEQSFVSRFRGPFPIQRGPIRPRPRGPPPPRMPFSYPPQFGTSRPPYALPPPTFFGSTVPQKNPLLRPPLPPSSTVPSTVQHVPISTMNRPGLLPSPPPKSDDFSNIQDGKINNGAEIGKGNPNIPKQCPYFAAGRCSFAQKCRFMHGNQAPKALIMQMMQDGPKQMDKRDQTESSVASINADGDKGIAKDHRTRTTFRPQRQSRSPLPRRRYVDSHRQWEQRGLRYTRRRSLRKSRSRSRSKSKTRSPSKSCSKSSSRSRSRSLSPIVSKIDATNVTLSPKIEEASRKE